MKARKNNQHKINNETKENILHNANQGVFQEKSIGKRSRALNKSGLPLQPLSEMNYSKSPRQMRDMLKTQEMIIYREFGHGGRLEGEFYKMVEEKLGNSKICAKIMEIKNMSNEEAVEEFMKIQSLRTQPTSFYAQEMEEEQFMEKKQQIFEECGNSLIFGDRQIQFKAFDHHYQPLNDEQDMRDEQCGEATHEVWVGREENYDIFEF